MSNGIEFGFEESSIIKPTGVETFKQSRNGEENLLSVISFRSHLEVQSRKRMRERGEALSDEEMADLTKKIDARLAETLKKEVSALTAVDRLDVASPKFWMSFVHSDYQEGGKGIGTIQCLSKYEGNTCVKPEICCDRFGEADQRVVCIVLLYPMDGKVVDVELFKARKYTKVNVWALGAKKFGKLDGTYKGAIQDNSPIIDLSVTLDGDAKYQKQNISRSSSATWARTDVPDDVRHWVLDQGIRASKYVKSNLGFEMSKDKLLEKLGMGGSSGGGNADAKPQLRSGYGDLLK